MNTGLPLFRSLIAQYLEFDLVYRRCSITIKSMHEKSFVFNSIVEFTDSNTFTDTSNTIIHFIHSFIPVFPFFEVLKKFYCYSITLVCIFSPFLHPIPAKPTSLPCLHPPLWFCPCVLYSSSCKPLSPLSPPQSPKAIVTLFLTSMSLVIFCLLFSFVD